MSDFRNADMPAMPVDNQTGSDIDAAIGSPSKYGMPTGLGLTKREQFAAMAMQAFITADRIDGSEKRPSEDNAAIAVDAADALLAELERLS